MTELQAQFLEAFIKASADTPKITYAEDLTERYELIADSEEDHLHKYFHVYNKEEDLYLSLDGHISGATRKGPWHIVLYTSGEVGVEGPAPEWVSSLVQSL
jgi:hypothetical protein